MEHTLGVMILDGDAVVCEAATGALTHGRIEVRVTTLGLTVNVDLLRWLVPA